MDLKEGFTLYLEKDLKNKLIKEAKEKRRSPSSIVNELLEKYFEVKK